MLTSILRRTLFTVAATTAAIVSPPDRLRRSPSPTALTTAASLSAAPPALSATATRVCPTPGRSYRIWCVGGFYGSPEPLEILDPGGHSRYNTTRR